MSNKLVVCPYDEAHKVKESRLSIHITKCRLNHLGDAMFTCSFNASHILPIQEKCYHLLNCPDKAFIDRHLAFNSLNKNNPYKGNTAVPSYTASMPPVCDEIWDEDIEDSEPAPGYVPAKIPPKGAIIEPPPLSKPSDRRKLYRDMHKFPVEMENKTESAPSQPVLQVNRQPKAPSQVENKSSQEFKTLGLGRGRAPASSTAPSRIAANIFAPSPVSQTMPDMSRLGLGRGYSSVTAAKSTLDDDFPPLGCGRGVYRAPKNDVKYPGSRN